MEPPAKKPRPQVPAFGAIGGTGSTPPTGKVLPQVPAFGAIGGTGTTPPAGKALPKVPVFGAIGGTGSSLSATKAVENQQVKQSAPQPSAASAAAASWAAATAPSALAEKAEKAAAVATSNEQDSAASSPSTSSTASAQQAQGQPLATRGPTPRAADCNGGQQGADVPQKIDPGSLHKDLRVNNAGGVNAAGGVYGFDSPKDAGAGKAIVLRLEPLKPGMPEYEKILGEHKQIVRIGSQRGSVDVCVIDDAVSKRHTEIELVGIKGELALSIVDYSTNGTYINGKRLQAKKKRFRIRSGDLLQIMDPSIDEEFGWKLDFGNTVAFFSRG